MTLCLMIYNVAQFQLRETLKKEDETLPNQINKPVQNPTIRWVFQIMEGIGVIHFYQKNLTKSPTNRGKDIICKHMPLRWIIKMIQKI